MPFNPTLIKYFAWIGDISIADYYDFDTYLAVYTVEFSDAVYVLHAFQKKSKKGIATPKSDIKLIEQRLKRAKEYSDEQNKKQ